ncbi:MAG: hypothetical protein AAFN78_11030 [Pseudomonadota bacterium]
MKLEIRKTSRSLTLLVAFAALITIATVASAAEHDASKYRMAVFVDSAYGDALVAGDFEQAIERLDADGGRFGAVNNLCVAYVMASDADNARAACDHAVKKSEKRLRHADSWIRQAYKRDAAIALTNRGVVLAVSGDLAGAQADFQRALDLRARLEEPEVNLVRVRSALANGQ